jgi:nucleotide-binding universal stress UspA family protein
MFQRIVVPLDGSELSEQALDRATEMARMANVPIHLVRVIDLGRVDGGGSLAWGLSPWALQRALDEEHQASLSYLERARRGLEDRGLEVTADARHGNTPDEILASVTEDDLIVMSTHGRSGVSRWFLGSVAESVVRRAPVPVMLVRALPAENVGSPAENNSPERVREMAVPS